MATYYISPAGSDSAPGTYADPWLTFTKAAMVAGPDDTVVAKNGTYVFGGSRGSYWHQINQGGTAGHPVIYTAETPGSVIFDGNYNARAVILLGLNSSHHPDNIVLEYLELKKSYWQGLIYNPDVAASGDNIIIRNCHLHHAGQRLEYSDFPTMVQGINALYSGANSHNWILESSLIHDIGRLNPELSGNPQGWPSDYQHNWIHDHGWYAKGPGHINRNNIYYNINHGWVMTMGRDHQFINNTCLGPPTPVRAGNLWVGVDTAHSPGAFKIENNIFYDGGMGAAIWFYVYNVAATGYAAQIRNNIANGASLYSFYGSSPTPNILSITFANNLVNTNPALTGDGKPYDVVSQIGYNGTYYDVQKVLYANVNIEIAAIDSPCVNGAYATDLPATDYYETTRALPVGTNGDIGAFELDESGSPPPPPIGNEITGFDDVSWTKIWSAQTQTGVSVTYLTLSNPLTGRSIIKGITSDAQRIRATLLKPDSSQINIGGVNALSGMWFGPTTNNLNIDAAPAPFVQMLYGGQGKFIIPAGTGGIITTDPVDIAIDHTKNYLSCSGIAAGGLREALHFNSGQNNCSYKYNAEDSFNRTAASGYTTNNGSLGVINTIEAADYPNVRKATLTTEPGTVTEDGTPLTKQTSIADVEANAGSWYWATNIIYIRPATGVPGDHTYLWQLPQGRVAGFPCDEASGSNITDTENGLTGIITNGSWKTWKGVDVILLDGSNSNIIVPATTVINNLTEFTYTVWVYPLYFDTSILPRIFSREAVNESKPFFCYIGDKGYIGASIYDETTQYVSNGYIISGNFQNRWSFITVTYDNTGDRKLHIYVNGQEINYNRNEAVSGTLHANSNDLYLGSNYDYTRILQGKMTKINIYNKALTVEEIATAYQNEWPVSERLYYGDGIFFVH